jgi:hypothetical protein
LELPADVYEACVEPAPLLDGLYSQITIAWSWGEGEVG